jgi:UDP-N-acetylglucosamine--N-acetylmuramyl-(pentapeptide) pyrophosphoryl-undecaprenol N-acetylglucosamine transferase
MITIAFTGGGTGGHIYPGLAVADRLKSRLDCRIVWIGSNQGIDRSIVEAAGFDFIGIPSGKLRRYLSLRNISDVFKVLAGFFAARKALKKIKPALLFSKGGFVSVPPCAAAASLGIPVFTHESDYSPGLATRLNLRWAELVLVAYSDTAAALGDARKRAVVVGNPVRPAFRVADGERGRRFLGVSPKERILLVLGGSQGARQVNELVIQALDSLTEEYVVVHQTGTAFETGHARSERYLPYPYLKDELPDILSCAELVAGRSGAGTVWEAATAGKPMVLIPLRGATTRGDQVENAEYFRRIGAAIVLGAEATAEAFATAVMSIAQDRSLRESMAAASAAAGSIDAADAAADLVFNRVQGGNP